MSESRTSSRLLALLDATSTPDFDPNDTYADVSDELHSCLSRFAMSTLTATESWTQAEEQQLAQLLSHEPRGVFLLRSLLRKVDQVEKLGPVPEEIIERQRARILAETFKVLLSKRGVRYAGKHPQRVAQTFDVARDPNENTTSLQHTQRLNHCEIIVRIETDLRQTFTIVLEFTFIEPQYKNQSLTVMLVDDSESTKLSKVVSRSTVEFEDLPTGSYTAEILADDSVIDVFRAELRLDNEE